MTLKYVAVGAEVIKDNEIGKIVSVKVKGNPTMSKVMVEWYKDNSYSEEFPDSLEDYSLESKYAVSVKKYNEAIKLLSEVSSYVSIDYLNSNCLIDLSDLRTLCEDLFPCEKEHSTFPAYESSNEWDCSFY